MRAIWILLGIMFTCSQAYGSVEADLEAIRQITGDFKVRVEHRESVRPPDGTAPSLKSESWTFIAGPVERKVNYHRFLNRDPAYSGTYPSLINADMGIGFDGGQFGNWYRGNTIRILVNGRDITAEHDAVSIEAVEGEYGRLRFFWEVDNLGRVALEMAIPDDGRAIYVRIDARELRAESVEILLLCFPGGYGRAYELPSHRWACTAGQSFDIPNDYMPATGASYPVVTLTPEDRWIFYADKLAHGGSLALLTLPEERGSAEVRMSAYGQSTRIGLSKKSKEMRLGFYAFSQENEAAKRSFAASIDGEVTGLKRIYVSTPGQ